MAVSYRPDPTPPEPHPLVNRALLYTGLTRARSRVLIVATKSALTAAIAAVTERREGLSELLG